MACRARPPLARRRRRRLRRRRAAARRPQLTIDKPDRVVGQAGTLEVTAEAPNAQFTSLTIARRTERRPHAAVHAARRAGRHRHAGRSQPPAHQQPVRQAERPRAPGRRRAHRRHGDAAVVPESAHAVEHARRRTSRCGSSRRASRSSRRITTSTTADRKWSSTARRRPTSRSGVRVGDVEYPGFPASGAGIAGADPALKVAFFALLHDQDLNTPIVAFARDEAGNQAKASFVDNVFEKPFKKSRIELDDKFINRVVPEILEHSPELKMAPRPRAATCCRRS